jgi:hypothetical protein
MAAYELDKQFWKQQEDKKAAYDHKVAALEGGTVADGTAESAVWTDAAAVSVSPFIAGLASQ